MSRPPMSMSRGGRGRGRPGSSGGRGGGRGGGGRREEGPPAEIIEVGKIMHDCESEMVCKLSHTTGMIPYFNASIYLENKKKIGKVDEIFGPIQKVMFTIKPDPGVFAKSFLPNDIMFISTDKLLPLSRFTNPSAGSGAASGGRSSRGGGGGRAMSGRGRGGMGGRFSGGRMGGRSGGRTSPMGRSFSRGRSGPSMGRSRGRF